MRKRYSAILSCRGAEYQLRWQPSGKAWLVLSQAGIETDSDPGTEYYPASVPDYTVSLLANLRIAGADVALGYYRAGKMRWFLGESDSKYNRLDLRLAKDWKTADGRIEAALVIQSLLGEEFESFSGFLYPQQYFKRRGYVSLKYAFR